MPRGIVLFRPVCRRNLKNPFKPACHHSLLVQLGRLGKIHLPIEVLNLEQLGTPFGAASDKLTGFYLGKVLPPEVRGKGFDDGGLNLEDSPNLGIPQGQYPVVQNSLNADLSGIAVYLIGQIPNGLGYTFQRMYLNLDASGSFLVQRGKPYGPYNRLRRDIRRVFQHQLEYARSVPKSHKGNTPEFPNPVNPAFYFHFFRGFLPSRVTYIFCYNTHNSYY